MMRAQIERLFGRVRVASARQPHANALFIAHMQNECMPAPAAELSSIGYDAARLNGIILLTPTRLAMRNYIEHVVEHCTTERLLELCAYEHARLLCECARTADSCADEAPNGMAAFSVWVQGLRLLYANYDSARMNEYERKLRSQAALSLRTGQGVGEVLAGACCLVEMSAKARLV